VESVDVTSDTFNGELSGVGDEIGDCFSDELLLEYDVLEGDDKVLKITMIF
jgi:hypothetical protein